MNFTQSFEDFSSSLTYTDIMLYAGAGIVLWVLFKDKLSPVQQFVGDLFNKLKNKSSSTLPSNVVVNKKPTEDLFFDLVASWKQTRDLAVRTGCKEAIKVADQMFPYLSPEGCSSEGKNTDATDK